MLRKALNQFRFVAVRVCDRVGWLAFVDRDLLKRYMAFKERPKVHPILRTLPGNDLREVLYQLILRLDSLAEAHELRDDHAKAQIARNLAAGASKFVSAAAEISVTANLAPSRAVSIVSKEIQWLLHVKELPWKWRMMRLSLLIERHQQNQHASPTP